MKHKILLVTASYYKDLNNQMIKSAIDEIKNTKYEIINVPGVFEIPVVISKKINKFDAFIAIGCVIKGETPHFNFISTATTDALMELSIKYKKPIGNGIITWLNKKQALKRIKKGAEAARAILSVLQIK